MKLDHALNEFALDVTGFLCADFGCNVGGFTDCLLRRGAAKVYAIDTAYGVLDYRLRTDERVVVMERTNALHVAPPWMREGGEGTAGKGRTPRKIPPHPNPLPGGEGFELPSPPGRGAGGEGRQSRATGSGKRPPLDPSLLAFARQQRKGCTNAERLMWVLLRDRRFLGLKFRRQHPVRPYVLDFYCDALKLAVELDGGQHDEAAVKRHDTKRTWYLRERGITVVPYWDHEVLTETEAVLEGLYQVVSERRTGEEGHGPGKISPHPNPLPGGEGFELPSPPGRGAGGEGGGSETPGENGVDLVTIDLGWTPQRLAIPAALRWLKPGTAGGRIISLVKPHYELTGDAKRELLINGRLDPAEAERIFRRVLEEITQLGLTIRAATRSPITGGKSARKSRGQGNVEFLFLATPAPGITPGSRTRPSK